MNNFFEIVGTQRSNTRILFLIMYFLYDFGIEHFHKEDQEL